METNKPTQHTQGRWTLTKVNNPDYIDIDADGERIVSIYIGEGCSPEAEANAKLISASPLMLEALIKLKEAITEGDPESIANALISYGEKAIKQATKLIQQNTAMETIKIHTAIISHKHGINVYHAKSHKGLVDQIFGYVEEEWSEEYPKKKMPLSSVKAIEAYFEEHSTESLDMCDPVSLEEMSE